MSIVGLQILLLLHLVFFLPVLLITHEYTFEYIQSESGSTPQATDVAQFPLTATIHKDAAVDYLPYPLVKSANVPASE